MPFVSIFSPEDRRQIAVFLNGHLGNLRLYIEHLSPTPNLNSPACDISQLILHMINSSVDHKDLLLINAIRYLFRALGVAEVLDVANSYGVKLPEELVHKTRELRKFFLRTAYLYLRRFVEEEDVK